MKKLQTNTIRHSGMFKRGQSGNPLGRPKADITIRDLAREHTSEAIKTLAEITTNKKASPSARVSAATALLDRGWGKPSQSLEVTQKTPFHELVDYLDQLERQEESENAVIDVLTEEQDYMLEV